MLDFPRPRSFLLIPFLIVFSGIVACNDGGGRQDCGRETSDDKKVANQLEIACLAAPENPDYCRIYLLQEVYKPHCW